jgi:glycerol-3-phosphate acyltransferase PlsY
MSSVGGADCRGLTLDHGWWCSRIGQMLFLVLMLTVLIYIRHAANLARIKAGTEPKIGGGRGPCRIAGCGL